MLPSTETLNPSPSTQILAAVSTTTVFTSPTNVPATDSSSHSSGSTTLIGPIVGGVLGGVLLAIIAVLVWHYWGKAIKQKEEEKRNEMLAFLNLRENTRRNAAAALQKGHNSYTPGSPPALQAGRTVKFSSSSSESNNSTVKSYMDDEKEKDAAHDFTADVPALKSTAFRGLLHTPARSSPLAQHAADAPQPRAPPEDPPPPPTRTPSPEYSDADQHTELPSQTGGLRVPPLTHKTSKASSLSMYSTQSVEEHQQLVPPSLILAALRRPDPRRPLVDRLSAAPSAYSLDGVYEEHNRLSNISAGSEYLQHADGLDSPAEGYVAR